MKAPAFDYMRVQSLSEALATLEERGEQAKIVAGGQSLIPALNLRLLAPELLIDISALSELKGIRIENDTVYIGALTRQAELLQSPDIAAQVPLFAQALRHVAHAAIRNRGTIGGNLAQADPASEMPACALVLSAELIIASKAGERRVSAGEFFTGIYETVLAPDEILVGIKVPVRRLDQRFAFHELARRSGDYAIVGLASLAAVANGQFQDLRLAYFAIGSKPTLALGAAARLCGVPVTPAVLAQAEEALANDLEPQDDLQATAAMRIHLAKVLLRRSIRDLMPEAPAGDQRLAAAGQ
jgi:carbon-monoxide dehydrogenase medium subunit